MYDGSAPAIRVRDDTIAGLQDETAGIVHACIFPEDKCSRERVIFMDSSSSEISSQPQFGRRGSRGSELSFGRRAMESILSGTGVSLDGPNPWDIQVRDAAAYRRALMQGSLGVGESYMDGPVGLRKAG